MPLPHYKNVAASSQDWIADFGNPILTGDVVATISFDEEELIERNITPADVWWLQRNLIGIKDTTFFFNELSRDGVMRMRETVEKLAYMVGRLEVRYTDIKGKPSNVERGLFKFRKVLNRFDFSYANREALVLQVYATIEPVEEF